jgi:hypothetical protein
MRRLAVVVAALGLVAPGSALASSGHRSHRNAGLKRSGHALALHGRLASIDGKAKVAVLSVGGARRRLVPLDLSHASVRLTRKHGRVKLGKLTAVRTQDRVSIKLSESLKTALADATNGVPAPVAQLVDERPCTTPPEPQARNPTVSGLVADVSGDQISITLGDGADARSVTLDVSAAHVYAGRPPAAADASSIVAGDRVLANLSVAYDTVKADLQSGTPVPVANLYDLGVPPSDQGSGGGDGAEPVILGGTITALADGHATISFGDGDNVHTAILDLSSATIYAGSHAATATVTSASALHVGDRVYAVLSVPRDAAKADAQAGTPIPTSKLYDAGAPTPPTPPAPPSPPAPPLPVIMGGTISTIGSGQVTISFGDPGQTRTATLDISSATIYAGSHAGTATVTTANALHVGDRVYAVLSVSRETALADVQAGTPISVSKLYDAGQ